MSAIQPVELKQFVENNPKLVTRRESTRYPGLFTLKYTRAVFYDALWDTNPLLLECRGLVVDADYNVVVKPFTKVFNYQENGTTIKPEELCVYVRKVNGFMACATKNLKYSDGIIISTTGSLDSEHVDIAKRHIKESYWFKDYMVDGETFIFEICDPEDPHIVTEETGAWLIGGYYKNDDGKHIRFVQNELDVIAKECKMKRYQAQYDKFKNILALSNTVEHEGFMVQGDSIELKIKSPYYLITKFLARMKETRMRNIIEKGNIREAMSNFDEEYYPLIKYLGENLDKFSSLEEQDRIKMIRNYLSGKE